MSAIKGGIPPEKFYGGRTAKQDKIEAILKKEQALQKREAPKAITRLLGPSTTWKVFKKQQDAIDCCLRRRNGLMSFAFEDINSRRMFLAAHPIMFWSMNSHRFFKCCNTYEVIREFSACKLYLDIEYEYGFNKDCNGDRMLSNILEIINTNLYKVFNIKVSMNDIMELDSSSSVKFSRHVIYEIRNVAFQDNYAVGNFIKKICKELCEAFENNLSGDNEKLVEVSKKYGINEKDIIELFVQDNKNKQKLFIDEGVYTKNRHFRVLGSSKQTKNIPLVVSKRNKYKPTTQTEDSYDCSLFLDSLITYFSWKVDRVLEFEESGTLKRTRVSSLQKPVRQTEDRQSVYPEIDSFINRMISPNGRVRRKVYFSDSSTIVYDIQGFRYCDHIKREHKSNNIKYIVDLQCLGFYQKCYDPDCADFRSELKPLPHEIRFLFEDDGFFMDESPPCDFSNFSDELFIKAVEKIEGESCFEETVTDEDLEKVMDCTEAMLDINW